MFILQAQQSAAAFERALSLSGGNGGFERGRSFSDVLASYSNNLENTEAFNIASHNQTPESFAESHTEPYMEPRAEAPPDAQSTREGALRDGGIEGVKEAREDEPFEVEEAAFLARQEALAGGDEGKPRKSRAEGSAGVDLGESGDSGLSLKTRLVGGADSEASSRTVESGKMFFRRLSAARTAEADGGGEAGAPELGGRSSGKTRTAAASNGANAANAANAEAAKRPQTETAQTNAGGAVLERGQDARAADAESQNAAGKQTADAGGKTDAKLWEGKRPASGGVLSKEGGVGEGEGTFSVSGVGGNTRAVNLKSPAGGSGAEAGSEDGRKRGASARVRAKDAKSGADVLASAKGAANEAEKSEKNAAAGAERQNAGDFKSGDANEVEIKVDLGAARSDSTPQTGREAVVFKAESGAQEFLSRELHQNLNGDIVRQAQLMLRGSGEATIKLALHPASLGNVKIKLEMADNKLTGKIVVESREALAAFESERAHLEEAFCAQGFESASLNLQLSGGGARGEDAKALRAGLEALTAGFSASSYDENTRRAPSVFDERRVVNVFA